MTSKSMKFILLLVALPLAVAANAVAQEAGEYTPVCRVHFTQSWEDFDAPLGSTPTSEFSKQMIKVFRQAGVKLELAPFVPWTRAIEQVTRGTDHGLSVALETPERAEEMAFLGPIFSNKWYVYKKTGTEPDLTAPKVGIYSTYAGLAPVQKAVADINGEIVGMPLQRLGRMLDEQRIDIIYAPELGIGYLQDRMKQALELVPGIQFDMLTYVAIRHDAPCMQRKEQLNQALMDWSTSEVAQAYAIASPQARTFADILENAKGQNN